MARSLSLSGSRLFLRDCAFSVVLWDRELLKCRLNVVLYFLEPEVLSILLYIRRKDLLICVATLNKKREYLTALFYFLLVGCR